MLSITILNLHNLLEYFLARNFEGLSAGYFVAADAAGAAVCFAAVWTDAFALVDWFAAVVAMRVGWGCFFLQEFSPL
jgi:hypothetical protein